MYGAGCTRRRGAASGVSQCAVREREEHGRCRGGGHAEVVDRHERTPMQYAFEANNHDIVRVML